MKRMLLVSVVVGLFASQAFADMYGTANVRYDGMIRGQAVTMGYTDAGGYFYGEFTQDAGLLHLTVTDLVVSNLPAESYLGLGYSNGFCIDLADWAMSTAFESYNVQSLDSAPDWSASSGGMGAAKASYVAELIANNDYNTASRAAAVQVAIWEIIAEDLYDWNMTDTNSNFYLTQVSAAVAADAQAMLDDLTQGISPDRYTALSCGPQKALQDYVVVPLPGAVLLGMFGLGAAGLRLRRRSA